MRDRDMSGYVFVAAVLLALFAVGVAHGSIDYGTASLPLTGGTLTGPVLLPNGAFNAPALSFSAASTTTGLWRETAAGYTGIGYTVPAGERHLFNVASSGQVVILNNTFRVSSAVQIGFSSNSDVAQSAADTTISRASAGVFSWGATTFAGLGAVANGSIAYCSDCTFDNPCAGSGTGAIAKRLNGAWRCD